MDLATKSVSDLALGPSGTYYSCDEFNHCIRRFNQEGQELSCFGEQGNEPGQFHYPAGLALVGERLFVADSWNHRIQIFDLDGSYLTSFGEAGNGEHQLLNPLDIKLGPDGLLYIVDSNNDRVLALSPETLEPVHILDERGRYHIASAQIDMVPISIKNPLNIFFCEDLIYIQEPLRLVRIAPETVHSYKFVGPRPLQGMIAATRTQVVFYDAHQKCGLLCDFEADCQVTLFETPEEVDGLFREGDRLHVFTQDQITSLAVNAFWSDFLNNPETRFFNLTPSGNEYLQSRSTSLDFERLAALAQNAFSKLAETLAVIQSFYAEPCFLYSDRKQTLLTLPAHSPLQRNYLTDQGILVVDAFESMLKQFQNQGLSLIEELRKAHSRLSLAQKMDLCSGITKDLISFFVEVITNKFSDVEKFGARVKSQNGSMESTEFQTLNGCIFHFERISLIGFQILHKFRHSLHWFGIEKSLIETGPAGLLVVTAKEKHSHFVLQLLKLMPVINPSGDLLSSSYTEAFERARWALEGAVKTEACLRMHSRGKRLEDLHLVYNSYDKYTELLLLFRCYGRLYNAYGFPYTLHQYMAHAYFTFQKPHPDFVSEITQSEAWDLPSIRYEFGIQQLLCFETKPGLETLGTAINMYEKQKGWKDSISFENDYVRAIFGLARTLAQEGEGEKALAAIEKLKHHHDYRTLLAEIYLLNGDPAKAQEVCLVETNAHWFSVVTSAYIHLCNGDWQGAVNVLNRAKIMLPTTLVNLYKTVFHLRAFQFEEALESIKSLKVVEIPTLYYYYGVYKRMLGLDREALKLFEMQQKSTPFRQNQIQQLITLRKLKMGLEFSEKLTEIPPDSYLVWEGKRILLQDSALTLIMDQFLLIEQACLSTSSPLREKLEHSWYLDLLLGQPPFFYLKDQITTSGQELIELDPDILREQ